MTGPNANLTKNILVCCVFKTIVNGLYLLGVLTRPKYFCRQCDINGISIYGWGKSQLRRQVSKAKDQHGRGLDNLQKQVRRFNIYQKLKMPYF
jgi:hypothetical protein